MALKWFRFANAFERLSSDRLDQLIDAGQFFGIGGLPVEVVLPSPVFKPNDHLMSVFSRCVADSKLVWRIDWRINQLTNHTLTRTQFFNRLA